MTPAIEHPWPTRDATPELAPESIHLWTASLHATPATIDAMRVVLAQSERDRAARFHFERDAHRYIMGRAILRRLLASYTSVRDARDVAIAYGPHGKPALAARVDDGGLHFNLAHSQDFALVGVARSIEIGVDVEQVHVIPDLDSVMKTSFAAAERAEIGALATTAAQHAAFFRCWTRKEAVLKALGWGLAKPLDSFEVSIDDDRPRVLLMDGDRRAAREWRLLHLAPATGFIGAAAWVGPELTPQCFSYQA